MAKFCGKCGGKLDEQTGKCPNCDKVNAGAKKPKQSTNRDRKKESKKAKRILITIIIVVVLSALIAVGVIGIMVYNGKLDIPYVNDVFVSLGIKDEEPAIDLNTDETNNTQDNTGSDTEIIPDEEADLGSNYEVPTFDAEEYFKDNTTLKNTFDVISSQNITMESEAFDNFDKRGFDGYQVTYEYDIDGVYLDTTEISRYSSSKHPMYQTYYTTAKGDVWMVFEVNGSFFATPVTYNFSDENSVSVIFSETDTVTSYDSTTNKFYVNIPNESITVVKTVKKIDAETLDKLTSEEIDKV